MLLLKQSRKDDRAVVLSSVSWGGKVLVGFVSLTTLSSLLCGRLIGSAFEIPMRCVIAQTHLPFLTTCPIHPSISLLLPFSLGLPKQSSLSSLPASLPLPLLIASHSTMATFLTSFLTHQSPSIPKPLHKPPHFSSFHDPTFSIQPMLVSPSFEVKVFVAHRNSGGFPRFVSALSPRPTFLLQAHPLPPTVAAHRVSSSSSPSPAYPSSISKSPPSVRNSTAQHPPPSLIYHHEKESSAS